MKFNFLTLFAPGDTNLVPRRSSVNPAPLAGTHWKSTSNASRSVASGRGLRGSSHAAPARSEASLELCGGTVLHPRSGYKTTL